MIICFTEYNANNEAQYKFGEFYVFLFVALFFFNSLVVIVASVGNLIYAIQHRNDKKLKKSPSETRYRTLEDSNSTNRALKKMNGQESSSNPAIVENDVEIKSEMYTSNESAASPDVRKIN